MELTQQYIDAYMAQTVAEWSEQGCEQPADHDTIGAFLGLTILLVFLGVVAFVHWREARN